MSIQLISSIPPSGVRGLFQLNTNRILFTQLGEEGVIYDTQANEYATLNETFFKILKAIEHGKNETEIVSDLCAEYDVSAATCQQQVAVALEELAKKGYITV